MLVAAPLIGLYPVFVMKALCYAIFVCAFNLLQNYQCYRELRGHPGRAPRHTRAHARCTRRAVSYSATFLFHWIPAVTETATRLPPGAPLAANPDVPGLQAAAAVLVLLFLLGATLQVLRLRASQHAASPA